MTQPDHLVQYRHERGHAQSWDSADEDVRAFVDAWVDRLATELTPSDFVGGYLHGSLATGSFYRPKSDIDILFVVEQPLTPERRQDVALSMCDLSDRRLQVGDLEMSVLRRAH